MRTDKEIEVEIKKLQELDKIPNRWNASTREIMNEQWNALCGRCTHKDVELALYEDETSSEYEEGDNDLYNAVDRAVSWMMGEKGYKAPSEGAL